MKLIFIMLAMCAKIVFPTTDKRQALLVQKPIFVNISKSWKRLTDSAEIRLPKAVSDFDNNRIKALFRRGDPCNISLGYDGLFEKEFIGFVTKVSADVPITIRLEDSMYALKIHPVSISIKDAKLSDVLTAILPKGIKYDVADISLGTIRYPNVTAAKVLQELQKDFGIYSYFKDEVLVSGKIYSDDENESPVVLHLEKNVKQSTRLNWQLKEDVKIKLRAVSTMTNGNKIKVELGDETGESRQLSYYNIKTKIELEKLAKIDYDKYKVDKLEGTINLLGRPYCFHGQKAKIISALYPDRNDTYYIDSTSVSYSRNGFQRLIKLGTKT